MDKVMVSRSRKVVSGFGNISDLEKRSTSSFLLWTKASLTWSMAGPGIPVKFCIVILLGVPFGEERKGDSCSLPSVRRFSIGCLSNTLPRRIESQLRFNIYRMLEIAIYIMV